MMAKISSKSVAFLCIMAMTFCPLQVTAQNSQKSNDGDIIATTKMSPSATALVLINTSKVALTYQLKNGIGSEYVQFVLAPRQSATLRNTTQIRIDTDNGEYVEYRIDYGNRYKLYWNPAKNLWDVSRLVPRR